MITTSLLPFVPCSMWNFDEEALIAYKNLFHSQNEYISNRYPNSPRLNRKFNKFRYRSHEDLMTRSTGFELPY